MIPRWASLNWQDRAAFDALVSFLRGRLEKRATIEWALRTKSHDKLKRLALLELVDSAQEDGIKEPWRTVWGLLAESWDTPFFEGHATTAIHSAQRRLKGGDRSGALVNTIVDLVAPKLVLEPLHASDNRLRQADRHVRTASDLLWARIASGELIDLNTLRLDLVNDEAFLFSLAIALEAALSTGLEIAKRIGWHGDGGLGRLGQLNRVYYVPIGVHDNDEGDPDEHARGIAPSVKLLHKVVELLAEINAFPATQIVRRWRVTEDLVHQRLWASLSRDGRITRIGEVAEAILTVNDECFWDLNLFPEISELRATRFSELSSTDQGSIIARIRKLPPRSLWPKKVAADLIKHRRLHVALRELRRIELAGAALPQPDAAWLEARIGDFPDLVDIEQVYSGYSNSVIVRNFIPRADNKYDLLEGVARLTALEAALTSKRDGWEDDPSSRASEWLRKDGNALKILGDFEGASDAISSFPEVWERFGWSHTPNGDLSGEASERDPATDVNRVLALLARLPQAVLRYAINGISQWLSAWRKQLVSASEGMNVWQALWPIAVKSTNADVLENDEPKIISISASVEDQEERLDTLNSPVAKLISVFLASCPNVPSVPTLGSPCRVMRDTIIATGGKAGLIARHRMIEWLGYFIEADDQWARTHLVAPLMEDGAQAIALWRAVARRTLKSKVLRIIGDFATERTRDPRFTREVRNSLIFSIVVDALHALRDQRDPAISSAVTQQTIRLLEDEVRAHAAGTIQRFIADLSKGSDENDLALISRTPV